MKPIFILTLSILLFSYAVNAEDISAPTDVGKISISSFSYTLLLAIIPAVATVIVPIVVWIMNRSGRIGAIRQLDYMLKRLELVSKLDEVKQKHGSTDNPKHDWSVLEEESSDVLSSILVSIKKQREETKKKVVISKLHWIKYSLLLFQPVSRAGWTFRILYYLYLYVTGISSFLTVIIGFDLQDAIGLDASSEDYSTYFITSLYSGGIAFLFHFLAIRNYKRYFGNEKIPNKEIDISKLSWIKYVLLWYRPASRAGWTFRCLYYYVLFGEIILIIWMLLVTIGLVEPVDTLIKGHFVWIFILLMYGGLAFLFHFLAMRNYKRCFANLEFLKEEIKKEIDISGLSRIRYTLLLYRPASPAGWTFHCMYYFLLFNEITILISMLLITFGLMEPDTFRKEYSLWISCFITYGGLIFLFHFLAIRNYKNYFTKIKSKVESMLASIE